MTTARALQLADHIAGLRADVMTRVGTTPPGGGVVLITDTRKGTVTALYQENHAEMYYNRRRLGPVPKEEPRANR